jgi:hypothetical protein
MKRKRITIAFVSSLIVVAAFNTAIVSANLGNEKCQLFLSEIASYTNWDDWGGWNPEDLGNNQVPGPSTHREDVSATYEIYEEISYGKVSAASTSITRGAKGSFQAYGISVGSNSSSTASLSGTTSSSNGTTVVISVTVPGEIYVTECVSPTLVDQCTRNDGFGAYCDLVVSRRNTLIQSLK